MVKKIFFTKHRRHKFLIFSLVLRSKIIPNHFIVSFFVNENKVAINTYPMPELVAPISVM